MKYIIWIKNFDELNLMNYSAMKKSTRSYIIILENGSTNEIKSILFNRNSFLQDVVDLTIALQRGNHTYSFFARDVETESKIILLNIWKHGHFLWERNILPKNRLQNLQHKQLRATSFEYEPFIYKENNNYVGYEVISFEM